MQQRIDASELIRHQRGLPGAAQRVRAKLWTSLRMTSFELVASIKVGMPVLSGRARASWGQWTPNEMVQANAAANAGDAIWIENQSDLSITQGTNVPYVGRLNAGHSQQAPAGFIDLEVEKARRNLRERGRKIAGGGL